MKKIISILSLLVCSISVNAVVITTSNLSVFKEALTKADSKTMVVCDIDDTLFTGIDQVLQGPYKLELMKKISDRYSAEEAVELCAKIWAQYKLQFIDHEVPLLMQYLQDHNIPTITLTAAWTGPVRNRASAEEQRITQLLSMGLDFSWAFPHLSGITFEQLTNCNKTPLFFKGVLFTCMQPKSVVLDAFLSKLNYKPTKIIFIDDAREHVEAIDAYCQQHNIECTAIHYTAILNQLAPLNQARADIQFETLCNYGIWLSDRIANFIMKQHEISGQALETIIKKTVYDKQLQVKLSTNES